MMENLVVKNHDSIPKQDLSSKNVLVVCDETSWIWPFIRSSLEELSCQFLRVPGNYPIRGNKERFQNLNFFVVFWENKSRPGGAWIEEVLDVYPNIDAKEQMIVITKEPTHQDIFYLTELGIKNILKIRGRNIDLSQSKLELISAINSQNQIPESEKRWAYVLEKLQNLKSNLEATQEDWFRLLEELNPLKEDFPSARFLDTMACLLSGMKRKEEAESYWQKAIDKNPNYIKIYQHLSEHYMENGDIEKAIAMMQRLMLWNPSSISRFAQMGEAYHRIHETQKAEHFYSQALEKDAYCGIALNGMAAIKFSEGDLESARKLLSRSSLAERVASELNQVGIKLVNENKFQEALEHYTKAQYVLPQQEKGPKLFYNIGLCYSKWGKNKMAMEFLKIALIKDPKYERAINLMVNIKNQ